MDSKHQPIADLHELLASQAEMVEFLQGKWTPTQSAYAASARKFATRKEVAAHHGVSPSTVTESLQAASYDTVRRAEKAREHILKQIEKLENALS